MFNIGFILMFEIIVEKYNSSFVRIKAIYEVLQIISDYFTFKPNNYQFNPSYKSGRWDGKIRLYDLSKNLFPIGLLSKLDYFIKQNKSYSVTYTNFEKSRTIFSYDKTEEIIKPFNRMTGRDYQIEGIRIGLREKNCILLSPTATGKSFIIYNLSQVFKKMQLKTLIIVPSIQLVSQLVGDFDDYSSECETQFSEYCHKIFGGEEKHSFKDVIISTYQSLMSLPADYFTQFQAVIVDECHTGSTDGKVIKRLIEVCTETEYKIGLSGTLNNEKLDEFSVIGMYGQIYQLTTVKKEVARGNLSPFLINRINLKYPESIQKQFEENYDELKSNLDKQKVINPEMNIGAKMYKFEIDYINIQPYKYDLICQIAKKCKGNTLILFKRNEGMGFKLHKKLLSYTQEHEIHLVYGNIDVEKRELIRKGLEKSDYNIILGNIKCMGTGINIKRLSNIIFAESVKSQITLLQSVGRGLRIHETKQLLNVYDICDDLSNGDFENYAIDHFNVRNSIYKKEGYDTKLWQKIT